jgi:hypothetical protein
LKQDVEIGLYKKTLFRDNLKMPDDPHENWDENAEDEDYMHQDPEKQQHIEIQKLFSEMERKAKKSMHYLELEGFVEKTEVPGVYKYTPEGLVLVQQQYKRMQDDGLI